MKRHPLDPLALVAGVVTVVAGVIAVLHQSDVIPLGLSAVVLLGLVVLGLAGAALVVLSTRRNPDVPATVAGSGSDEATDPD
jgi:hypothetical protein